MKDKKKKDDIEIKEETPNEEIEEIIEDIQEEESEVDLLKKEVEKLKNDYARAYADTENLKKRLNQEAEQTRKYRIQSFAMEILPTIDNLERALAQEVPEDAKGFYDGIKIIYDQLINALKNEGVKEIEALDKEFDPNYHQALMLEKVEDKKPGIVLEVLQKGYLLKDRILRPAMVKVSE